MKPKSKTEPPGLMSCHIQRDLQHMADSARNQTWRRRLWILCHGSYLSAFVAEIVLAVSHAATLTGTPSKDEFFYSSALSTLLSMGALYQIFWLRNRRSILMLHERLLVAVKDLKAGFDEHELKISSSLQKTMMVAVRGIILTFTSQVITMIAQPLPDARLPAFMRGMKPFSPGMLVTQALHFYVSFPSSVSCLMLLISLTKFVFYLTIGYKVIGRRLRNSEMTNFTEVRDMVRLHSEWTSLSAESENLFSFWNGVLVWQILVISLVATTGVIRGVRAFEVATLVPCLGAYLLLICRLGELLKQQSMSVAGNIYHGNWSKGGLEFQKMVLLPMTRAKRPAFIRATLIGSLTLEKFLNLLKQWYRFVQLMLNAM